MVTNETEVLVQCPQHVAFKAFGLTVFVAFCRLVRDYEKEMRFSNTAQIKAPIGIKLQLRILIMRYKPVHYWWLIKKVKS